MSEWWEQPLEALNTEQWEALCDGCARCCLHKLEDEDTGDIFFTRVRCRYLDESRCSCTRYSERTRLVPECIELTPANSAALEWLPRPVPIGCGRGENRFRIGIRCARVIRNRFTPLVFPSVGGQYRKSMCIRTAMMNISSTGLSRKSYGR